MQITTTSSGGPIHGYYAVKVRSRAEVSVSASLREKGFDVLLPTFCSVRKYSDRIRKVDCAVFPGYVFVAMNATQLFQISVTPGVAYIVKICNSLQPLPAAEIALLHALCGMQNGYEPCETFAIGEQVRIESGPLRGQTGILIRKAGRERVVLSLNSIFSSVSIDLHDTIISSCSASSTSHMPVYQELRPRWTSISSGAA